MPELLPSALSASAEAEVPHCIVLDSLALVPQAWRGAAERFRVFNPTLVAEGEGYALCYRVVADNTDVRRIATCRLDRDFRVVEGSVTPLSDLIAFARADELNDRARTWHADPRYLRLRGRLHLIWNDGANRPVNHQFILAMDTTGLRPEGLAREITCSPEREPIEKNWMLFEAEGAIWATYSIRPHHLLKVDFDDPLRIVAQTAHRQHWFSGFEARFGILRGSAQPLQQGDTFLAIAHSSYKTATGRKYCAAFYRYSARAPFEVLAASEQPLHLPNPRGAEFEMPKLNRAVAEVIYPCGLAMDGPNAVIAYGLNDEACAIAQVPMATIEAHLPAVAASVDGRPFEARLPEGWPAPSPVPPMPTPKPLLPLFWWDAQGKKLDGGDDSRLFATGNFGDIASREIVERVMGRGTRLPRAGERKLLAIGSVLHTAREGDIVWGTGAKGGKLAFTTEVKHLSVHAVRGPLTAEMLRSNGIDITRIQAFFDPGCLIPGLYAREIDEARRKPVREPGGVRIIPHYRDDRAWRARHPQHVERFVSVDDSPAGVLAQIAGANRVVSSSLHGLIFAEALGIPAVWLAPDGKEDPMKYYDYYYGSGRSRVKVYHDLEAALAADPMPLPRFDPQAYLASFPHDEVAELARESYGLEVGSLVEMGTVRQAVRDASVQLAGFERTDRVGAWITAPCAHLRTLLVGTCQSMAYRLALSLHPYNPPELPEPQALAVRVNGGPYSLLRWAPGTRDVLNVDLVFEGRQGQTPLHVEFIARHPTSPQSLGQSPITQTLAACLRSVAVHRAA